MQSFDSPRGGKQGSRVKSRTRNATRRPTEYRWHGRLFPASDVVEPIEPRIAELSANGLTWIHVDQPGPLEAAIVADRFGFHELDIEDVLSKRQRPKIDEYESYAFIVLHFPFYDKTVQRLNAAELDIFIGSDFVITLPNVDLLPVTHLFDRCEKDEELRDEIFSKGSGYLLYHILDDLFDYCFPILDKIGWKLDAIEDDLFEGRSEEIVRDISNTKQEIIAYRKIIKPERATVRSLERYTQRFLPEDLELYFDDIVDAAERIWDLLDNYKEVVEALEQTNESIISHRQQYRLQILTVFSVIFLPLTLISGIFGMNWGFGSPGFIATVSGMVALFLIALGVFRWRRWL
jgi:magnesium transporter